MKQIIHSSQSINYELKRSRKAKRMRIAVYCDSTVVVTVPFWAGPNSGEDYLKSKLDWVIKALNFYKDKIVVRTGRKDFLHHYVEAKQLAKKKVEQWNEVYGFKFGEVNVKDQRTRWGSCSKKGNLNFNYKIVHLPEDLVDYLVVHELCHLKEFNHSKKFWDLVSAGCPNYKAARLRLKQVIL